MTRVFCASAVNTVALLAAHIDSDPGTAGRRVLLVANEGATPEIVRDPQDAPGFATLAARFDEVVSWNELIAPLHPSVWRPPERELPVLERLIHSRLAPDGSVDELLVESVTEGPGRSLAALLPDARITVVDATAAAYGPSLGEPVTQVLERITRLLHCELLPGLRSRRLDHVHVPAETVPADDLAVALAAVRAPERPRAVLLHEDWVRRGVLNDREQRELYLDAVRGLVAGGHDDIVLAPHPAAAPEPHADLVTAARELGAGVTVAEAGLPHEAWLGTGIVAGVSAPALFLAGHGVTTGTLYVLERLARFDHPERTALTLAHAALPALAPDGGILPAAPVALNDLLDAVSYCMSPALRPDLRECALRWVESNGALPSLRRRLEHLELPVRATSTGSPWRGRFRTLLRNRG